MQTDTDTTYNGWVNYATWGVALVLSNDEGTYSYVNERLAEIKEEAPDHRNVPDIWSEQDAIRFELADFLKDYTEELCGLGGEAYGLPEPSMMASQVIAAGLADVDWQEIADNWLTD